MSGRKDAVFEIGSSLREARERRGLELAQVAAETRIRATYLAALENERFDLLPGRVYARAFLREYAEHLGLDGQRFLDEYDARLPGLEEPPITPAKLPQPVRLRPYATVAAALAALLLGLLAWHSGSGDRTTGMPTTPPPPPPPPTTKPVAAPARPKPPPRAKLVLTASGPCWLEVHLGSRQGRTLYYGTLEAGERARFVAARLWIRLGAPWNLSASLNRKPVSLPGTTTNVLVTPRGVEVARGRPAR